MKATLFLVAASIMITIPLDAMNFSKIKKSPTEKCWDGIEFHKSKKVAKAIKNGADVNFIIINNYNPNEQMSLLQLALSQQHIPTIQELLKAENLEVNSYPIGAMPPLHYAVSNGKSEHIRLLLAHPKTDINILDSQGRTCLFKAVYRFTSALFIGKILLDNNIDTTIIDKYGNNILHHVSQKDEALWVNLILSIKNPPLNVQNKQGDTSLHIACKTNAYSVVKTILESKHAIDFTLRNNDNNSVFDIVLDEKCDDIISLFFDTNPKEIIRKHRKDKRLFAHAVRAHKLCLLKEFLPSPYVKDEKDWVPLILASERGYIDMVELLLEQKNCNHLQKLNDGRIALHCASQKGHLECVKKLSTHDGNLDYQDYYENTPLHLACFSKRIDVIDYLVEKGANTLVHNANGLIPFVIMYQKNLLDKVKQTTWQTMLEAKDSDNNTLFHKLAEIDNFVQNHKIAGINNSFQNSYDCENILTFLIDKKLNIHARNNQQLTPLDIILNTTTKKPCPSIFCSAMVRSFLGVVSDNIHYVLFEEILNRLPNELRIFILKFYYKLNIETIFAKIAKIQDTLLLKTPTEQSDFKQQLLHDLHYFPLLYRPAVISYE